MKPSPLLALCLLLPPLSGTAAGLGELAVLSRIGEPLRAEVGIIATPEENLEAICFSLENVRNADLPVITRARLTLEKHRGSWHLRIAAGAALNEPLATLRLRAGCGVELQRDYIVMPLPPDSRIELAEPAPRPAEIAPPPKQRPAPPRELASKPRNPVENAQQKALPAPAKLTQAPVRTQSDRLVLGSSPMLLDYTLPKTVSDETEERMLRMETSLARLNESLQSLDSALALGVEARTLEQELQLAIALQNPPAAGPLPPEQGEPAWRKWLELIFGTLLGGVLSALALQWLSRFRPGYRDR